MAVKKDSGWELLSNHGKVLLCVAQDPGIRVAEIAEHVGIKERAVQRILADLREAGVVTSAREGRRNRYRVNRGQDVGWSPSPEDVPRVGDVVDAFGH